MFPLYRKCPHRLVQLTHEPMGLLAQLVLLLLEPGQQGLQAGTPSLAFPDQALELDRSDIGLRDQRTQLLQFPGMVRAQLQHLRPQVGQFLRCLLARSHGLLCALQAFIRHGPGLLHQTLVMRLDGVQFSDHRLRVQGVVMSVLPGDISDHGRTLQRIVRPVTVGTRAHPVVETHAGKVKHPEAFSEHPDPELPILIAAPHAGIEPSELFQGVPPGQHTGIHPVADQLHGQIDLGLFHEAIALAELQQVRIDHGDAGFGIQDLGGTLQEIRLHAVIRIQEQHVWRPCGTPTRVPCRGQAQVLLVDDREAAFAQRLQHFQGARIGGTVIHQQHPLSLTGLPTKTGDRFLQETSVIEARDHHGDGLRHRGRPCQEGGPLAFLVLHSTGMPSSSW